MTTRINNIEEMTIEERAKLYKQFEFDQKALKQQRSADIETLKTMQDEFCGTWLSRLLEFSKGQSAIVEEVFTSAKPLIDLKSELYEVSEDQGSHKFTARDGSGSISVGYNMIIGFDGTSDIGVQKIHNYLGSLSKDDENRIKIEKIINVLMKRNSKGELNPTRIVDLVALKSDIDDELFTEGVDIVVASQFRTKTTSYVDGWMREITEEGKELKIQFRITAK